MTTMREPLSVNDIDAQSVPVEVRAQYRRFGYINDLTLSACVERAARQWGSRPAVIESGTRLTYQELLDLVGRAGCWLTKSGVRQGDVVVWQTPNWWEAHVLGLAIWHIGAVSSPVAPFYREHELRGVIEQVRPAAVIAAESFRGFAHAEAFDDLLADAGLTAIPRVVLRGSRPGWTPFDDLVSTGQRQRFADTQASDPCLVLFTSGTTSPAKAAVHSSQTLLAETRQLADSWGLSWEDVAYMAAPLQHITGVLNAMTIPLLVGASAVLAERWDADEAVQDMIRHRVTWSAGATIFLQELTDAARGAAVHLPLRMFACGGASVPRAIMERSEAQGIPAARVYGMTELPTVTVMNRAHPFDMRAETDGMVAPGVEVRIVDEQTSGPLANGLAGEIVVRGPERMLGYLDAAANRAALDDGGWFRTGDVGILDDAGCVTVTGRLKDVINRGGEKFSARDIEDVLAGHPAVRQAAIVAGPDERFGEVPVAFVVVSDTAPQPSVEELSAHLLATGMARQKTPVAWYFVDSLPMTPSGKVKKFELVDTVQAAERQG
jgi:acyl-CoA synthetase (AMP-forming)/AMP-acid ligase II